MKKTLIKQIEGKGLAVIADEDIKKGEIIEETLLLMLPKYISHHFGNYVFIYPKDVATAKEINYCLPLGNGIIYNHSDDNNCMWFDWEDNGIPMFRFIAQRDIKRGEEICTYYGQNWWNDKNNKQ